MSEIVVLSAGKVLNPNLYPFFEDNKKNVLITNYRKKVFKEFKKIYEIHGFSNKKIFDRSNIFVNKNWKKEKSCGSLLKFIEKYKSNKLFISYSDIIFNEEAITKLKSTKNDIAFHLNILPDKIKKKKEKININKKFYEFSGLILIRKNVLNFLKNNSKFLHKKFKNKNLSFLINYLMKKFSHDYCVDGNVKDINYKLPKLLFFTKGHALEI